MDQLQETGALEFFFYDYKIFALTYIGANWEMAG